jgi:hypothetical protein
MAWLYRAVRDGVRVGYRDDRGQIVCERISPARAKLLMQTLRDLRKTLLAMEAL